MTDRCGRGGSAEDVTVGCKRGVLSELVDISRNDWEEALAERDGEPGGAHSLLIGGLVDLLLTSSCLFLLSMGSRVWEVSGGRRRRERS